MKYGQEHNGFRKKHNIPLVTEDMITKNTHWFFKCESHKWKHTKINYPLNEKHINFFEGKLNNEIDYFDLDKSGKLRLQIIFSYEDFEKGSFPWTCSYYEKNNQNVIVYEKTISRIQADSILKGPPVLKQIL